ncbi:hypothetical protein [Paracraurococcus lichenis]|uniref:Uncharacterized protein n=1 Tax=Paracraurococcus lichenis TaxID=3064888 RepID=A0ABT9E5W5_9PROT|nr:hypothetical protein [Paracraurococcus sp. LOR1-02]MDO9711533.1 hypothetical protein [Paracraurococcus sp. LOR1-02]
MRGDLCATMDRPVATTPPPPPLHTPLVWAWGGLLLTVTTWLTGVIALFHSLASLFD